MKGRELTNEESSDTRAEATGSPLGHRPLSYLRFRMRGESSEEGSVSTLPPPPFENETDVASLEWWLEAHMNLAGGQLCVEQALAVRATPPDRASSGTSPAQSAANAVSNSLESLRDALYEMYCDAADPRLHELASTDAALGRYVRTIYVVIEDVVSFMLDGGATTPVRKTRAGQLADTIALVPPLDNTWIAKLAIDSNNPLEPLRHLSRDVTVLSAAVRDVAQALRAYQ